MSLEAVHTKKERFDRLPYKTKWYDSRKMLNDGYGLIIDFNQFLLKAYSEYEEKMKKVDRFQHIQFQRTYYMGDRIPYFKI